MKYQIIEILKHLLRQKRSVYLDNNATTKVSKRVQRKMNYVLKYSYGNPSSLYAIARNSAEMIEEARQYVANAINSDPREICFTGCASESNNAILKSLSNHFYPKKKKIISTPTEHSSVINTLEFLTTQGIKIEYCSVDKVGRVLLNDLEKMIDDDTFLICCMLANNEIGTIQNLKAITELAAKNNILVLSDCVQAFGKIPIDVKNLGIHYASFSAHKLYGPKGVGALYIKQGSPFEPFIHGGHQEDGLRAGTESIHNITGFGEACRNVSRLLEHVIHINDLKSKLINQLKEIMPEIKINSPDIDCLSNTISVTFPDINSTELMALLDYHGIAVSGGSACSSKSNKSSHVLKAIGLTEKEAEETLRISLGEDNTLKDIRYFLKIIRNNTKNQNLLVDIITSKQLNKDKIFDDHTYILDVRPTLQRRTLKSLPNSHEVSYFSLKKHLNKLPKEKHIIVVCQHGNLSYIATCFLKTKGFNHVSTLSSGILEWKEKNKELYEEFAGHNIAVLQ